MTLLAIITTILAAIGQSGVIGLGLGSIVGFLALAGFVGACLDAKKNLGVGRCADIPGLIKGIITTPADFEISESNAALQTQWQAALVATLTSRVYLWPYFSNVPEFIGSETAYEDTPLSYLHVLDGRYRWRAMINKSLCFHKAAFTHRSNGDRVWLIDSKNNLIGTYLRDENGEAILGGFSMDLLNTENLMFNDGSVATKTPLVIALKDPNEVNHDVYGAVMVEAAWINQLAPLTTVDITLISADASTVVVSVTVECDKTPVNGLIQADFAVTDAGGSPIALTGATETGDGIYTLTSAAAFVDSGAIALVDPASLSVYPQSAYEDVPATLTVPYPPSV